MGFISTGIEGLMIFEPKIFEDPRGYFFESFNKAVFEAEGISCDFLQDNQSRSSYGVVRGLHYQLNPHAQTKLVRVLSGRILDVVVDIRRSSATYGQVFSVELSSENKRQLYIPKGFAHGFSVLSETAEVLYKCDALYNKAAEGGILFNDPELNIDWQIPAEKQVISDKDRINPSFREHRSNFE